MTERFWILRYRSIKEQVLGLCVARLCGTKLAQGVEVSTLSELGHALF